MAYCTVAQVRLLSGLKDTEVGDDDINLLIAFATAEVNKQINIPIFREQIRALDSTRENEIDAVNTIYSVFWSNRPGLAEQWFIGDQDNDGDVDTSDITVHQVESDGTETTLTVSSIDPSAGSFVLSAAPDNTVRLYVSYQKVPVSESTPDILIQLATAYLSASLALARVNARKLDSWKIGKISAKKSKGAEVMMTQFMTTIHHIFARNTEVRLIPKHFVIKTELDLKY